MSASSSFTSSMSSDGPPYAAPPPAMATPPWTDAIGKAMNILKLSRFESAQHFDPSSGRLWYASTKNYVLAGILHELSRLQDREVAKSWQVPQHEHDQLEFLNGLVPDQYKIKAGLNDPKSWRWGLEKDDSKIVNAAVFFIKDAKLGRRSSKRAVQLSLKKFGLDNNIKSRSCSSILSADSLKFSRLPTMEELPVSAYNLQPRTKTDAQAMVPLIAETKHEWIAYSRISDEHKIKEFFHIPQPDLTFRQSLPPGYVPKPPAPKPRSDALDFGDRLEQALLKMDKWATAWLRGEMGTTDLAWESFEFCLCMPDILDDMDVVQESEHKSWR